MLARCAILCFSLAALIVSCAMAGCDVDERGLNGFVQRSQSCPGNAGGGGVGEDPQGLDSTNPDSCGSSQPLGGMGGGLRSCGVVGGGAGAGPCTQRETDGGILSGPASGGSGLPRKNDAGAIPEPDIGGRGGSAEGPSQGGTSGQSGACRTFRGCGPNSGCGYNVSFCRDARDARCTWTENGVTVPVLGCAPAEDSVCVEVCR